GTSLGPAPQLDLRLAHARARDAVHAQLDEARLVEALTPLGLGVLAVASAAADRTHYLMRPNLGRRLAGDAVARLAAYAGSGRDVAIVIADGLSARAVEMHARPLLAAALPRLPRWPLAPTLRPPSLLKPAPRPAMKRCAPWPPNSRSCGPPSGRPSPRPTAWAPISPSSPRRKRPTRSATASPTSAPKVSPTPTPRLRPRISCAPCARGKSRACNSRTTASCSTEAEHNDGAARSVRSLPR